MKLVRVKLKNFRCYKDETIIEIGDLTTLIGKNECGKSSILDALQIFFDDLTPDTDDATTGGDKSDVRITCEFAELPSQLIIDADFPTSLRDEYLLNQEEHLEICKIYDCTLRRPKANTYAVALHPSATIVDDLLTLKNEGLKLRTQELKIDTTGIDLRINTQLRKLIWNSAQDLQLESKLVPLDEESAKQIWDHLKNRLPSYSLFKADRPSTDQDEEAQDPMKSAIKEAIKQKEEELAEISKYVEQQVKEIAEMTVSKLKDMDPSLASQLNPRFSTPNWANVFKVSLTGDDDIPINKRGSGVRRLILLNFFRAKAEQKALDKGSTRIIYGVEEPEASQHPDNQRMLVQAFSELATQPDCQVILSTHVPMLARLLPVETLRFISIEENSCRRIYEGNEQPYERVSNALGVLPDHNVKLFIGVEGPNDINFLKNVSKVLCDAGEDVPNLIQLENMGHIIFIPMGGSNLAVWASRLQNLNIPEFHLFDRSCEPPNESPNQTTVSAVNARPNCIACLTGKLEIENYLHPEAIKSVHEIEISFDDYDDVPTLAAKALHEASESISSWDELNEEDHRKKESRAKLWLNNEAAAAMTPELLTQSDTSGDVRGWLQQMAQLINQ